MTLAARGERGLTLEELAAIDAAQAEGVAPADLVEQTGISARLGRVAREAWEPALFDDEALRARYDEARRAATLRIRRPVVPAYDDPSAFRGVLDTLADAKAPLQALRTLELTSGDLARLSAHWRGRLPLDARGKAVDLVVGVFDLRALLPEAVDHDEVRPLELPWVAAARARAEAEAEAAKAFQMAPSPEPVVDDVDLAAEAPPPAGWTQPTPPQDTTEQMPVMSPFADSTAAVDVESVRRAFQAKAVVPAEAPLPAPKAPGIAVPLVESTEMVMAPFSLPALAKPVAARVPAPISVGKVTSLEQYAELAVRLEKDPSAREALAAAYEVPLPALDLLLQAWSDWIADDDERRAEWRLHRHRVQQALEETT